MLRSLYFLKVMWVLSCWVEWGYGFVYLELVSWKGKKNINVWILGILIIY